jgi:hemerythrin
MVETPSAPGLAAPRPAADDSLLWSDARRLGHAPMDRTHEEFFTVVLHLLTCDETTAAAALAAFEAHAVSHFEQEEGWMRESAFPAAGCHADEHAAVLASVREVQSLLADGRAGPPLLHRLAEHLLDWFPGHADHMDSALAGWMVRRAHGGAPVVLRRREA